VQNLGVCGTSGASVGLWRAVTLASHMDPGPGPGAQSTRT
jgi:hypothetical protein